MFPRAISRASRNILKNSQSKCSSALVKRIQVPKALTCSSVNQINRHQSTQSTAAPEEVDKFRILANSWWNVDGEFKALHSLNPLRIGLIRSGLMNTIRLKTLDVPEPFKGVNILDVGCGGGILSEPLARLGGNVTGIDATEEGINVARSHAEYQKLPINYVCSTIEQYAEENPELNSSFDVIVMSEVIEHVLNPPVFISTAAKLLKPGGSLFVTTINRTLDSWCAAIVAAEYLLGLVPRGTHSWDKFVKPEELGAMVAQNGLDVHLLDGMYYNLVNNKWQWAGSTKVNYAMHAVKRKY